MSGIEEPRRGVARLCPECRSDYDYDSAPLCVGRCDRLNSDRLVERTPLLLKSCDVLSDSDQRRTCVIHKEPYVALNSPLWMVGQEGRGCLFKIERSLAKIQGNSRDCPRCGLARFLRRYGSFRDHNRALRDEPKPGQRKVLTSWFSALAQMSWALTGRCLSYPEPK